MSEHTFARNLTRRLREAGAMVWKINDNYAGGVPDMWVAGTATDMWIELKNTTVYPKRPTTRIKPDLSAQQLLWISQLQTRNRRVVCIANTPAGALIFEDLDEMRNGIERAVADSRLMPIAALAQWILKEINNGNTNVDPGSLQMGRGR